MVDYKAIPLEVVELKAGTDGWSFSAYASTFNTRDLGGDTIRPGAFDKSLKSSNYRPLLWQHDQREPIGIEKTLAPDRKGLLGTWELIDTQRGADAYKLLKRGAVRSMSIGYIPSTFEFVDEGQTRVLKEIELLENSVVSVPMNPHARVQSVKHLCAACSETIATAGDPEHKCKVVLESLTFSDLAGYLSEVADVFGASVKTLLTTLATEGRTLNESKRQELETLLGTFPGLDAVRADVQHLLQTASGPTERNTSLGVRLALARRRARAAGVEV